MSPKPRLLLLALGLAACAAEPPPPAARAPGGVVVDSARSVEEELARFRSTVGGPVRELGSRYESRDALVRAFARALERGDTSALAGMVMSAREFAWLYYPYTIYTHPPYQQAPGMVWLLTTQNSQKGLARLLERYATLPLDLRTGACSAVEPQDLNQLHVGCSVTFGTDTTPRALFGTIIERNGRFKFVSYANGL